MSEQTFRRGDRVAVACQQVHTTYGGLSSDVHEHTGVVAMTSVKGNVYVHLDDDGGQPRRCTPASLTKVVAS